MRDQAVFDAAHGLSYAAGDSETSDASLRDSIQESLSRFAGHSDPSIASAVKAVLAAGDRGAIQRLLGDLEQASN